MAVFHKELAKFLEITTTKETGQLNASHYSGLGFGFGGK